MAKMFNPTNITDNLLFSTVRIETNCSVGTGFIFNVETSGEYAYLILVTNKHVVEGADNGKIIFHLTDKNNSKKPDGVYECQYTGGFAEGWTGHPDSDVDLCAVRIGSVFERIRKETGRNPFFRYFGKELIKSNEELAELTAMEDVIMVGYPNGLWDSANRLPLLRRGITSSFPGVDFEGRQEGVVDIACFPGSSGSPILIVNQGAYIDKTKNSINMGSRTILLGALYAGPFLTAEGTIEIKKAPVSRRPISKTDLMIHLGYYIKATRVLELGEIIRAEELGRKTD